jgi:hypothetical protein
LTDTADKFRVVLELSDSQDDAYCVRRAFKVDESSPEKVDSREDISVVKISADVAGFGSKRSAGGSESRFLV